MGKNVAVQYDYEALVVLIRKVVAEELSRSNKTLSIAVSMDMLRDIVESTYYELFKAGKLRLPSKGMSAEDLLKLMNNVDKARKGKLYDTEEKQVKEGKIRVKVSKGSKCS